MSETMNFKVFCLENYKQAHKLTVAQTLDLFKKYAILDYIDAVYDSLHSTGSNNNCQRYRFVYKSKTKRITSKRIIKMKAYESKVT